MITYHSQNLLAVFLLYPVVPLIKILTRDDRSSVVKSEEDRGMADKAFHIQFAFWPPWLLAKTKIMPKISSKEREIIIKP